MGIAIRDMMNRLSRLEEQNGQLRNTVDRLQRYVSVLAGNMAGADTDRKLGLGHSEIPVVTDVCLDAPIFWGEVEGQETAKLGRIQLIWNGDHWEGGGDSLLLADLLQRDEQTVTDPESVIDKTMVMDTYGTYRYLANAIFPREEGGMYLNDQLHLISPTDDVGQLAVVYETFTEAPLGDGRINLALPICVLV